MTGPISQKENLNKNNNLKNRNIKSAEQLFFKSSIVRFFNLIFKVWRHSSGVI